jgi:uncharacterized membrane protein
VRSAPVRKAGAGVSLLVVLAATVVTLTAGALVKQPCAAGDWVDGRQYKRLCYSDIIPLYGTEQLQGGRLPYLDQCRETGGNCDEYPVLTMYLMRLAGWMSGSYGGFFWANVFLLSLLALATTAFLYATTGERSLFFAVAPTLMVYAFVNWDLLAVALTAGATWAYLRDRDHLAGALIGLGTAAKLYPVILLVPLVAGRWRERRAGGAVSLVAWSAVAYALVNLPFYLLSKDSWLTFFRFNRDRLPDFDSLWYLYANARIGGRTPCSLLHLDCSLSTQAVNVFSLLVLVVVVATLWWVRRSRDPEFPRWTLGFPLIVTFLLANKVYSPQYGLWLLPSFPLALPSVPLFVLFEATDIAVFVTRFSWFGRHQLHVGGAPLGAFQLALLLRAIVLIACLVAWVLRREPEEARPEALVRETRAAPPVPDTA